MGLRRSTVRGGTPNRQIEDFYRERGNVWEDVAFTTSPVRTHPNDIYLRVFPDGTFDRSWQGIQKDNPVAQLSRGSQWATIPNPLQRNQLRVSHLQKETVAHRSIGAGTALAEANQEAYERQAIPQPGLLATILGRLRG